MKQYTKEYGDGDVLITFYEDGVKLRSAIVSRWGIKGYLSAKHEEGWVEAYSQEQFDRNEEIIQKLLKNLKQKQRLREEMKNNLIKED